MNKRTTILDLAKALNLSPTLISMVLNGKGNENKISQQTQKKVLETARKMNYTPNQNARALRTGKTNVIGLIVPDISNAFYASVAREFEDLLEKRGYRLILSSTGEDAEKEKRLIKLLLDQNVDGIISASTLNNDKAYQEITGLGKTVVLFDRTFNGKSNLLSVAVQNTNGTCMAVEQLFKQGKKTIGFLTLTPAHISTLAERKHGYLAGLRKFKLKSSPSLICEVKFEEVNGGFEKVFGAWLKKNPGVDGVVVANHTLAMQLMKYLKENHKEEFGIISFDDHPAFEISSPSVTAVSQPVEEIAAKTIQLLMDSLDKKEIKTKQVVLPVTIIKRQSHNHN